MKNFALMVLLLAAANAAYAEKSSAYTSLEDCQEVTGTALNDDGYDYVARCHSLSGYATLVAEHDMHIGLIVAKPGQRQTFLMPATGSMQLYNPGKKLEWRIHDGKPVALIVRFRMAYPDAIEGKWREVLTVARLGQNPCVVADVPANQPNANVKARQVADRAAGMRCVK